MQTNAKLHSRPIAFEALAVEEDFAERQHALWLVVLGEVGERRRSPLKIGHRSDERRVLLARSFRRFALQFERVIVAAAVATVAAVAAAAVAACAHATNLELRLVDACGVLLECCRVELTFLDQHRRGRALDRGWRAFLRRGRRLTRRRPRRRVQLRGVAAAVRHAHGFRLHTGVEATLKKLAAHEPATSADYRRAES